MEARLSEQQWRSVDQALRRLYEHADHQEFPVRLLSCVGDLISSEITCYTELNPNERTAVNVADRPDHGLDALLPVLAELQMQHPRLPDFLDNGEERALATSDYLSRREWHRRELYQHFYKVMNLEDQLIAMLPASPDVHLGVVFNRGNRSFTDEERAMFDVLTPHIKLAYRNARAVTRLKMDAADGELLQHADHGLVRLRVDGQVWFSTRRARDMLDDYWPAEPRASWTLPGPVHDWIRREIHLDQRNRSAEALRAMQVTGPGGSLLLRLLRQPEQEGWLLLLEDRAGLTSGPPLPPRLEKLLDCLLTGASEKEVAARLKLSRHTVHEYAKQLYRHFEVSSRAELMARFVRRRPRVRRT